MEAVVSDVKSELGPIGYCNLGDLVAEKDHDLKSRYVPNQHYDLAKNPVSVKLYFIGKKGFGKSALLQMVRLSKPNDQIIDLGNQDLGLDLLALEPTMKVLPEIAQSLVLRAFWRAALTLAVYEKRGRKLPTFGKTAPHKALESVRSSFGAAMTTPSMLTALGKMISRMSFTIEKWGAQIQLKSTDFTNKMAKSEFLRQISLAADNLKDLIDDRTCYILIDDLDQGWSNQPLQNAYLAALFDAIEKFSAIPSLKFVVSLRLDIFRNLKLQNPDKLIQHIHRLSWTTPILRAIVDQRLQQALNESKGRVLQRFNLRKPSKAIEGILVHCFPHPRDAIWTFQKLLDLAAKESRSTIDDDLVARAIRSSSNERVGWICSEWQHIHPWLPAVLAKFKDGVNVYTLAKLEAQLRGLKSATPTTHLIIQALLQTSVVGVKYRADGTATFYFAEDPPPPKYVANQFFELHPAVRHALQSGRWQAP